jgi:hypothetical protein
MKLKIFAAAAMMSVLGTGACDNACGLRANQLANGWTCDETTERVRVVVSCVQINPPPGPTRSLTTRWDIHAVWTATNPGGDVEPEKSGSELLQEGIPETNTVNGQCGED